MYQLSLAGGVFVVGLVLWFRPVLGLVVLHHYRGPAVSPAQRTTRERVVRFLAVGSIVTATAAATAFVLFWSPPEAA